MFRARGAGLDLVEVDPHSRPPVCRIMDYGKWKYSQRKKEQKSKSHRHETELKEVRIKTPKIGEHDLGIKINAAKGFLSRGDRVQFILRFRGRELAHIDEGKKVFQQIRAALVDVAKIEQDVRYEGKRISMMLAPGAAVVAKPAPKPAAKPVAKVVDKLAGGPSPVETPAPAAVTAAPAAPVAPVPVEVSAAVKPPENP